MGEGKVAVVIPYYHTKLNEIENISFRQCLKVLYGYPIILVTPDTMKKTDYPKGYDFDILNSLEDERLIGGSTYKAKSTYITDEGIKKAKELMKKYNVKE